MARLTGASPGAVSRWKQALERGGLEALKVKLHVSLLLASKFYDSVRPSARWVLLTRILFATRRGLGQQTLGTSPRRGEFSLPRGC